MTRLTVLSENDVVKSFFCQTILLVLASFGIDLLLGLTRVGISFSTMALLLVLTVIGTELLLGLTLLLLVLLATVGGDVVRGEVVTATAKLI